MTLHGKGFMIWQIPRCEGGNAEAIASTAQAAGLTHVMIKIADGPYSYNINRTTGKDLVPPVIQALRNRGIKTWGWHYVYGDNPTGEAQIAVKRILELGLDGYIIDAEAEYKEAGKKEAARRFMSTLRAGIPSIPVALCSYRYPTYHPQLPWTEFLNKCDYNMPQVYWQEAHNPGAQLKRCLKEFQAITPFRPIIPIGSVYRAGTWDPTAGDALEFLNNCISLNLTAASFYEWYYGRTILTSMWDAIASFPWGTTPTIPQDITSKYIQAVNSRNTASIAALYDTNCVHVTASETVQGIAALRNWYANFFSKTLPNASFILTGVTGTGNARYLKWQAVGSTGKIINGTDTLGLSSGKILYHYSFFTVNPL